MKIKKRDGSVVGYSEDKIVKAIESAMEKTDIGVDIDVAKNIAQQITKNYTRDLDVETVQDIVEHKLMSSKRKDVAREYITYRNIRTDEREKNSDLMEFVSDVIDLNNIENENANMPEWVFTAKNVRMSSEVARRYAITHLLDKRVKDAFLNNEIYIHDFNSYAIGSHNCLTIDLLDILERGFETNNGDVRPPSTIRSAMQLTAVILQCQSNNMFGGIAVSSLDYDLAPYVAMSFVKHFKTGLKHLRRKNIDEVDGIVRDYDIAINNDELKDHFREVYDYAHELTKDETCQSAEALIHNLNTLQSRAGDQLPFTSVNFGTDITTEGRMVSKALLHATIRGIGKKGMTPIFPISIFKHMKGVNANEGDPNYDIKKLAIECSSKRIYPNFANIDAPHLAKPTNKLTEFCTMG